MNIHIIVRVPGKHQEIALWREYPLVPRIGESIVMANETVLQSSFCILECG